MSVYGFITLHDMTRVTRKTRKAGGKPIRVKLSSIDVLRGYNEGDVRCVVTVHGVHYHVAETIEQIEYAMRTKGYKS